MSQDEEIENGSPSTIADGNPKEVATEGGEEQNEAESEEIAQEGDEAEADAGSDETADETNEDGEEASQEVEETPKKSRAKDRILKLKSELDKERDERRAEREERDRIIAERAMYAAQLENLRQQQVQAQSDEQRRQQEDRLSLLDPTERALYETQETMRQMQYKLDQMEIMRKDDRDRAEFHAKAAHDPLYKKYADEIERSYQDGLKRGVTAPREDLLAWRLGKELLQNKNAGGQEKKAKAAKKIDSVTSKPATARGDVAASKSSGKSLEERLKGVQI